MSYDDALPPDHRLSHYRIQKVLGRGGFGVTYLAVDERGGGQAAVKEYLPVDCAVRGADLRVRARSGREHEAAFRWGLDRFRNEGQVLARFNHPNIVRVVDDFEAHGTACIVMACVRGETLSARLAREAPLDEEGALAMVLPVVDGLEQVHAAGYLHRDIKPANIVIGAGGAPVLLDFGSARRALGDRTRSLTAVVSDGYAPIEQYGHDARQGPWTDVHALGAVLYHCLTGRPPPGAPDRAAADKLASVAEASPGRLSPGTREAVDAALSFRAEDRPRTLAAWRRMFGGLRPGSAAGPATAEGGSATTAVSGTAETPAVERPEAASPGDRAVPDPDRGPAALEGAAGLGRPPPRPVDGLDRDGSDRDGSDLGRQRQRLVDWVRCQLIGPAGPGQLAGSPVERYPTGVLHPVEAGGGGLSGLDPAQSAQDEDGPPPDPAEPRVPAGFASPAALPDDEDDEADDAPAGADGTPGPVAARPVSRRRYVPPSSVGLSFYVRGDARLRITASAAGYRRMRDPSGRFVTGEARYERTPFKCGLVWPTGDWPTGDGAVQASLERPVSRRPYRDGDVLTVAFADRPPAAAAGAPPAEAGEGKAQIDVRRRPYGDGHILTVVFANPRRAGRPGADRAERSLFEARLECAVESGELAEYPRADPALLTDEEREIELRYRDRHIYAIGHGAAADWSLEPGRPPRIRAEFMPAVDVPGVTAQVAGVLDDVLVMRDIAEAPGEALFDRFDAFVDGYDEWVGEQRATAGGFAAGERQTAARICDRMDAARNRMRGGVARLRRDPDAARAFRLANRAMLDQMRQRDLARGRDRDAREYRWRPFQLAFLLTVIESTIDEQDPCRGVLDLIWFPTGGGKTEAYLGLFAFLVVWRRLRHGAAGGGTVAIMRYTLRLLTRQQFERAARIVCALERLRRRRVAPLGDEPVTVGLWVGAAASPNTFEQAAKQVADLAATVEPPDVGAAPAAARPRASVGGDDSRGHHLVLQSCPWCGRRLAAPHGFRAGPTAFEFLCGNRACAFGDGRPLPCNVVDEALYERPPTLLVGTVDKFARLAWEERAAAFFGGGARRPPELVIQDELHLIAGPLGSVAGLYEAAVETVIEQRGVRPKYVASTATIRMAGEQVRRLYGREMAVFPPPGLSADDSWFARTDRSGPGRSYVGYLAPGLDQQRCLAPLAAVLLTAPTTLFAEQQDRDLLLDAWWTQVIYHGSLRGVGVSHNAFVTDVRTFMRRLADERREAARDEASASGRAEDGAGGQAEAPGRPASRDDPFGGRGQPAVAQLTSQSTAQENARTFDRLEAPRGAPDCLDAVLATNMISVGVDVDRLAAMVVNGQPLTTAEYIQASSRIGRADVPGLVVTNYYRHQARSLSHYENFRPYHESFHRFVEPASVTPFTHQVRRRALHAALVIALRHGCAAWTADAAAGRFDKDGAGVRAVVDALKVRCRRAAGDAAQATAEHLDRLVDQWHDEAARCRRERRGLRYDCRDNSADRLLGDFDGTRRGRWKTLHSMRNVEETAVLGGGG